MRPGRSTPTAALIPLAAAAAFALASTAVAQPTPPRVVTNPDWESTPTAEDVSRLYPPQTGRVEGRVRLSCLVASDGRLSECTVAAESPAQAGFGEAALKMAPLFKMKPQTRDGQPVGGAKVNIPIIFRLG